MGIPAKSRKGKKAWRQNISDQEIVHHVEAETHQARRGPAVETLADSELFFVDKGPSVVVPAPTKRKASQKAPQLTRAQLILQAPAGIKPVVMHKHPKKEAAGPGSKHQRADKQGHSPAAPAQLSTAPIHIAVTTTGFDLWQGSLASVQPQGAQPRVLSTVGPTSRVGTHRSKPLPAARIKAVEVDLPGCSYNPDFDSHQDALAVLVASENRKELKKQLAPQSIPQQLPDHEAQADELAHLQTDAVPDDENEIQLDMDVAEVQGAGKAAVSKKTKTDRNRAARREKEDRQVAAKQALKRQRAQLDTLPDLLVEVQGQEQAQSIRRKRRQVVQEEKAAQQPPRLGKQPFQDLNVQVLTSDEVGQGLRRLKAFPMLATERFKSLQKRGIIEPRKPTPRKGQGKRVVYEKAARTEKAVAGQEELEAMRRANRSNAKVLTVRA